MKSINLPLTELKPALTGLGKVIQKNATLPVLSMIKVERTNHGWIALTGTDLDSFVTVRLELAPSANISKLREKEPYFRDALVRAGHRTPFTLPTDISKIDTVKLVAALTREANTIAGPGQIRSVVVTSQAPRRRMSLPRT